MTLLLNHLIEQSLGEVASGITFNISTLGCRLNQYESEKIASSLVARGFSRVLEGESAELQIINTCTVTHRADADSRQLVRRALRNQPESAVVIAGCFVDSNPAAAASIPGVSATLRNSQKSDFAYHLSPQLNQRFPLIASQLARESSSASSPPTFAGHHRAWLKISDGCNQWCSFCILPTVRGRLRNRPPEEIFEDLCGLSDRGYREIVITGINPGHYSSRSGSIEIRNLAELIRLMIREFPAIRFRISSIEPQTVRTELRELYADAPAQLCRHWHLPLQSGSFRILKLMKRPYDASYYMNLVNTLKKSRTGTVIGADVIVGFPGETDEDFQETYDLAKSSGLDYLHVFSYSDRQGTAASLISDKIHPQTIRERNRQLTELSYQLKQAAMKREIGSIAMVIAEGDEKLENRFATTDNFLRVLVPDGQAFGLEPVAVRIIGMTETHLLGERLVRAPSREEEMLLSHSLVSGQESSPPQH